MTTSDGRDYWAVHRGVVGGKQRTPMSWFHSSGVRIRTVPRSGGAFLLAPQAGYTILIYDARFAELDMESRHGDRKIQAAPDRRDSDQV